MEEIILRKFEEWTKGLDPQQARVSIFNHIRDIPYKIIPELRDPVRGPVGLLEYCKGMCTPKHYLLKIMFDKLGIPVKFATYQFNWDDPNIKYPPELKKAAEKTAPDFHIACKAYIDGRWVIVDATYDTALEKFGFAVTENWDGHSDSKIAVLPIKEVVHESLDERVKYITEQKKNYTREQVKSGDEFKEKLNLWLEGIRGQSGRSICR